MSKSLLSQFLFWRSKHLGLCTCNTVWRSPVPIYLRSWNQRVIYYRLLSEWRRTRARHFLLSSDPHRKKYPLSRRDMETQITNLSMVSHVLLSNPTAHGYFLSSLFLFQLSLMETLPHVFLC